MRPPRPTSVIIAAFVTLAGIAGAEAPATAPKPAIATPALGQIATALATEIALFGKEAVVFGAPLGSDEPAPRAGELTAKLTGLVAGALGPGATARQESVPLATAQALAKGAKALVFVQAEIAAGQLRASADVYHTTRNVWDRARRPAPAPFAHAFASARLDAEVRAYLAPLPL
ncbi:MAG TPA: hypothetical protein VJT73_02300, partial [Polyangiaceae bacterium]|nr:hypothetical protein [Polyangiaceae bacterium]